MGVHVSQPVPVNEHQARRYIITGDRYLKALTCMPVIYKRWMEINIYLLTIAVWSGNAL